MLVSDMCHGILFVALCLLITGCNNSEGQPNRQSVPEQTPGQVLQEQVPLPMLPSPKEGTSLVLRTDFSDDAAWEAICAAIESPAGGFRAYVDCVSDPQFSGATVEQLVSQETTHTVLFIVDSKSLTHADRPILVVDLFDDIGRTFRVIPSEMWGVENNLSIANMDFREFADSVDEDGIFRGFAAGEEERKLPNEDALRSTVLPQSDHELPRRLRLLNEHLGATGDFLFLDFEFSRAGPLDTLFPEELAPLIHTFDSRFRVFAGDGSGGLLALDVAGHSDLEDAAVVYFSSEGFIGVLGESADDFLALVASTDQEELSYRFTRAKEELQNWIKETGVDPYASAGKRMIQLAPITRDFREAFWTAMREASQKLRPDVNLDQKLIFGKQFGDVRLGMPQEILDERWGKPEIPDWGRDEGRVTAFYPEAPFVIELNEASRRVESITLYAGIHRAVADDGTDLMFMPQQHVLAWLKAKGVAAELRQDEILAPAAKLRLGLGGSAGRLKALEWVETVELTTEW